jgi:hypothetical protein
VVTAVVAATLAGVAAPAYADDTVGVSALPLGDFSPGESQTLRVQVENKTNDALGPVTVTVSGLSSDLQVSNPQGCEPSGSNACSLSFADKGTKQISFTVKEIANPNLAAGQQRTDHGSVQAAAFGGHTASDNLDVRLHGPNQAANVPEVSGTVVDSTTGTPIKDAIVVLQDGAGKNHQGSGTDASGRFRFTSASDPIAPGTLMLSATKDQYDPVPKNYDGKPGQAITGVKLQLKPAAATPTAGAVLPSDNPLASGSASGPAGNATNTRNAANGTSLFSWVLIVLGGLLVLLGIGAIVLLLVRRKDDGEDADEEYDGAPPNRRGPGPVPASQGVYRGAGADPTMVARTGMMGDPGMSNGRDATAMIRPGINEYPDPYSPDPYPPDPYQQGPRPPRPTSPMPGGQYPPTGYDNGYGAGYGAGSPGGSGVYGDPRPGYGPPPPPAYPPGGSDYGPPGGRPEPGYGGGSGYGPSGPPGAGGHPDYRDAGGSRYEEPAGRYDDGGYRPGYDPRGGGAHSQGERGGYDPGYDRNAGYDRVPEEPRGGYDGPGYAPEAYYDDQAGTPSRRSAPPNRGGDRRSLDWLDD